MNEPKVIEVLPGFWALNKEKQAQMIAKLEKMKAERGKPQEIVLTPEQEEMERLLLEAEKNGTLVIEGWEAMSELADQLEDGGEL